MIIASVLLVFLAVTCIFLIFLIIKSVPVLCIVLSLISTAASGSAMWAFWQALQETGRDSHYIGSWVRPGFFWGFIGLISVSVLMLCLSIVFYRKKKKNSNDT